MRYILFLFSFFIFSSMQAQYKSATVGIDGLTCSMCANSVERLVRQLDFVEDVKMDLNSTTALVTFYPEKKVNIKAVAKKVQDSGFSVRFIKAFFNFDNVRAKEGLSFLYEGDEYIFVKTEEQQLVGKKEMVFVGKDYLSKKEFTHWKNILSKFSGTAKDRLEVYYIVL